MQDAALEKRPECTKSSLPKFMASLSLRGRYLGQVKGMLQLENVETITFQLLNVIACNGNGVDCGYGESFPTGEEFLDAMWTLTSLLISSQGDTYSLNRREWLLLPACHWLLLQG